MQEDVAWRHSFLIHMDAGMGAAKGTLGNGKPDKTGSDSCKCTLCYAAREQLHGPTPAGTSFGRGLVLSRLSGQARDSATKRPEPALV